MGRHGSGGGSGSTEHGAWQLPHGGGWSQPVWWVWSLHHHDVIGNSHVILRVDVGSALEKPFSCIVPAHEGKKMEERASGHMDILAVEGGREGGRERGREGWREGGREGEREGGREGGRERGREGGRDAGREGCREGGREGGREGRREGGRDGGMEGGRDGGRGGGREAEREGEREGGREGWDEW